MAFPMTAEGKPSTAFLGGVLFEFCQCLLEWCFEKSSGQSGRLLPDRSDNRPWADDDHVDPEQDQFASQAVREPFQTEF